MVVYVDDREGDRIKFAKKYFKEKGMKVEKKHLIAGDFVYKDKVCVEYKTAMDIMHSIMDKRVFRQSKRMQKYPVKVVVIVGNVYNTMQEEDMKRIYRKGKYPMLRESEFIGSLVALINELNVVMVETQEQAFEFMWRLFLKSDAEPMPHINYPPAKLDNPCASYLYGADGIGAVTAKKVTKELNLNNLSDLLNVTMEKLLALDNFGKKKANRVMKAIYGEGNYG